MLPTITGLYAGLSAFLIIALTVNVVRQRMIHKVGIGDGGVPALHQAIRIHGNALEYIPFTLLLMSFVEMQHGLAGLWIHVLGILFLVGRVWHVAGLSGTAGTSIGRRNGMVLSLLVILILAIINIALFFGL